MEIGSCRLEQMKSDVALPSSLSHRYYTLSSTNKLLYNGGFRHNFPDQFQNFFLIKKKICWLSTCTVACAVDSEPTVKPNHLKHWASNLKTGMSIVQHFSQFLQNVPRGRICTKMVQCFLCLSLPYNSNYCLQIANVKSLQNLEMLILEWKKTEELRLEPVNVQHLA